MGAQTLGTQTHLRSGGKIYPILLWLALMAALGLWPHAVAAQSPEQAGDEVRVGDRWVYESKDEITGFPKDTFSQVVTEVSPKEIVVNLTFKGKPASVLIAFDHDWNRLDNPSVRFKPNDGQGIRSSLAVGKEWRAEYEARATQTGVATKGSVISKVVGQESITTPAGTFDTFKIETRVQSIVASDPSRSTQYENVGWWAPKINHWVRRKFITRLQNRVQSSSSEELTDFSRKF
jgi:hypothetical protein